MVGEVAAESQSDREQKQEQFRRDWETTPGISRSTCVRKGDFVKDFIS